MISMFIFVFLLLGNTQATPVTVEVKPNEKFEHTFDPGFVVKHDTVKLDGKQLAECSQKTEDCYSQILKSEVKFVIAEKSKCEKVQFTLKKEPLVTYVFNKDGELVKETASASGSKGNTDTVTTDKYEKTNFPLDCQPDGMQIILKAPFTTAASTTTAAPTTTTTTSTTTTTTTTATTATLPANHEESEAGHSRVKQNPQTVVVQKKCSETLQPTENCFDVLKKTYPVTVKATMASAERKLELADGGNNKVEVFFKPESTNSAANLMPRWAAVILANIAIVYFFY